MSLKKAFPMLKSWNDYLEHCYPNTTLSAEQHNECQQAYYGGYVDALATVVDLLDWPPEKAKEALRSRIDWLVRYHKNRAEALGEDTGDF